MSYNLMDVSNNPDAFTNSFNINFYFLSSIFSIVSKFHNISTHPFLGFYHSFTSELYLNSSNISSASKYDRLFESKMFFISLVM